jgi:hypothetical protein
MVQRKRGIARGTILSDRRDWAGLGGRFWTFKANFGEFLGFSGKPRLIPWVRLAFFGFREEIGAIGGAGGDLALRLLGSEAAASWARCARNGLIRTAGMVAHFENL